MKRRNKKITHTIYNIADINYTKTVTLGNTKHSKEVDRNKVKESVKSD